MSVCILQNLEKYRVLWTDFSASRQELNRFSVSKIGPKPAKPTISLAVTLVYMSWLTDFAVLHCFEGKFFSFDDTFETIEFVLSQIAYTFNCSSFCNTSMQPPVSLTFINVPTLFNG